MLVPKDLLDKLASKYSHRLNWAHDGKDNFYDSLKNPDIKRQIEGLKNFRSDIIVYGKAQSGKTTLILKLLNISTKYESKLHSILRASRPVGSSSSIAAMIYSPSTFEDDFFYWKYDDELYEKVLSESEVSNTIINIREKIRRNNYSDSNIIHLKIPKKYFGTNFDNKNLLKIIDLPGIDGSDLFEEKYVRSLFLRYVPEASLILLVSVVNSRSTLLHPIIDMANWWDVPFKYRLVLTRSASNASIRKKYLSVHTNSNIRFSESAYMDYYVNSVAESLEIKKIKFDVKLLRSILYPIDCGTSWNELASSFPKYYKKVQPVMENIFQNLRHDLKKYTSEYYQLKSPVKLYNQLDKYANTTLDKLEIEKQDIKMDKKRLIKYLGAKKNELRDIFSLHKKISSKKIMDNSVSKFSYGKSGKFDTRLDRNKKNIRNHINNIVDHLNKSSDNFLRNFNKSDNSFVLSYDLGVLKACKDLVSKFESNSKIKNMWFLRGDKLRTKVVNNCDELCKKLIKVTEDIVNEELERKIKSHNKKISDRISSDDLIVNELNIQIKNLNHKVKVVNAQIEKVNSRISEWRTSFKNDKQQAEDYLGFLLISFKNEWSRIREEVVSSPSTSSKIASLFGLYLLNKELETLTNTEV